MKLRRYIDLLKEGNYDSNYYDEDDESSDDDGMESVCSLLRKMYRSSNINDVFIEHEDLDVKIFIMVNKVEKMKTVMKVLDVTKKIADDILIQYNSEFELWETKDNKPLISISFLYNEGVETNQTGSPI